MMNMDGMQRLGWGMAAVGLAGLLVLVGLVLAVLALVKYLRGK